jgi:isopentenyl diphosphate isomerase/L-lactate dehydrogenase-like FMN-dependent dehydrogenase
MRLILFLAALALGADALVFSGSYTQAAWREGVQIVDNLLTSTRTTGSDPGQKS